MEKDKHLSLNDYPNGNITRPIKDPRQRYSFHRTHWRERHLRIMRKYAAARGANPPTINAAYNINGEKIVKR